MASKRKLWATSFPRIAGERRRHQSEKAAYEFVRGEVPRWTAGALRSQHLTVWVDERDGHGWRRYEDVDLAEWAALGVREDGPEGQQ